MLSGICQENIDGAERQWRKNCSIFRIQTGVSFSSVLREMQAMYVLPYFLPQFKEKYPSIDMVLTEAASEDIEEKLIKGEVEVGIVHPPLLREELEYFEINHDELVESFREATAGITR